LLAVGKQEEAMSDLREELAKFLDNFAFVHTNPPLRRALFDRLPPFVQALQVEWAEKVSTERVDAAVKAERERVIALLCASCRVSALHDIMEP